MDEFEKRFQAIDRKKIVDFLSSLSKPCYESELLKIAFENADITGGDALELYQNHFLLFCLLYELQNEFYDTGKYLHIHFMRTFLYDYPRKGECRFFNEELMGFCHENTSGDNEYCEYHRKRFENEVESLSIKYFYLDRENFSRLDRESAESFINGAWEILGNYEEYKKSFAILDLPESSSIETIKRQFKVLAKRHHPDHGESSHKKFNEINRAYRLLLKMIPIIRK